MMFHFCNTSTSSLPLLLCFCRLLLRTWTCCTLVLRGGSWRDGTSAEYASSTGYVPKRIELGRIFSSIHKIKIDDQDDMGDWSNRSPSAIHWAFDFGSKTNKYVRCWHHHCTFGNERKNGETRGYHSERKSFVTGFSRDLEVSGKLDAVFSCQSESIQNIRERISVLPEKGRMQSSSTTHYQLVAWRVQCMKTKDEQNQKVRLTPRVPRVVSKTNSQCGQQDVCQRRFHPALYRSRRSAIRWLTSSSLRARRSTSRICSRGFDGSLSRRLRVAGASAIGGARAVLLGEAVQEDRGKGRVDAM